jgi:Lar family restriction alleviation protein
MTTEPDDALLPCPFCGGEPYIGGDEAQLWFAGCYDCHCMVGEGYDRDAMPDNMLQSKEEAIAAWNHRAGHTARDAEMETLRAENERLFSFVRELANNPRKPATWMQTRAAAAAVIAALGSRT